MSEKSNLHGSPVQRALLRLIGLYRRAVSPLLPPACRFHPSCSEYASEAIATHGMGRGVALAAGRIARCHPWCDGGLDPVPVREHSTRTHAAAMKGRT